MIENVANTVCDGLRCCWMRAVHCIARLLAGTQRKPILALNAHLSKVTRRSASFKKHNWVRAYQVWKSVGFEELGIR